MYLANCYFYMGHSPKCDIVPINMFTKFGEYPMKTVRLRELICGRHHQHVPIKRHKEIIYTNICAVDGFS